MASLIRKCQACNKAYQGQLSGRNTLICNRCSIDCDEAYKKIHKFLSQPENAEEYRGLDKDRIAEAVDVHPVFVKVLILEGKFGGTGSLKDDARRCKQCNITLKPVDQDTCETCNKKLFRQFQQDKEMPGSGMSAGNQIQKHPPRDEGRRKYGLGKQD